MLFKIIEVIVLCEILKLFLDSLSYYNLEFYIFFSSEIVKDLLIFVEDVFWFMIMGRPILFWFLYHSFMFVGLLYIISN